MGAVINRDALAAEDQEAGGRWDFRSGDFKVSPNPTKPVYITTPIYYVNAEPHIGHVYTTLLADALSRWFRDVKGAQTTFLTGTDEHGQKIARSAEAAGIPTLDFCTKVSMAFKNVFDQLGFRYNRYIRTTEELHHASVEHLWNELERKGFIYKGKHEGWYCVSDENFCTELQVERVTQPDGSQIVISKESGRPVEWFVEENYFFKLSAFQGPLLEWLNANEHCVYPKYRRQEVINFVAAGLIDLSVTRTNVSWGIKCPSDPNHTIYVWLDALTNYLTGAGYPNNLAAGPDGKGPLWPADYHIVGKDILKFHAIYWPAFLLAAGLPLPKHIVAHGWWTKDDKKIGKSSGNGFDVMQVANHFGYDSLRFFLLRDSNLQIDGDITYTGMLLRNNTDLADTLGNLASRLVAPALNADGVVPQPRGALTPLDEQLIALVFKLPGFVDHCYCLVEFQRALHAIWEGLYAINKFLSDTEPWKLKKAGDTARLETVLYVAMECVRVVTILLYPIIPTASDKILTMLGLVPERDRVISKAVYGLLQPGTPLPRDAQVGANIVFEKKKPFVDESCPPPPAAAPAKAKAAPKPKAPKTKGGGKSDSAPAADEAAAPQAEASVGELDIRVGRIVSAAKHPKADRLYVEQIDLGEGAPRTICSGLAEHMPLDQLQNALVLVLANLKAIKLVGVESNGMVLCASSADKSKVVFVSPPAGARVGERITFNGVANGPDGAVLNPKHKTFDLLKPHLLTNAAGVACFKGLPFSTSAGPCTATLPNAQIS